MSVRLTGPVAMADDEFGTVADGALLNVTNSDRGAAHPVARAPLGPAHVRGDAQPVRRTCDHGRRRSCHGRLAFNLISVAFAVLFVGIGVDFGIQFSVRYRRGAPRQGRSAHAASSRDGRAGRSQPLALAADRDCGRLLCLPADRLPRRVGTRPDRRHRHDHRFRHHHHASARAPAALLRPPPEPEPVGYALLAPVDRFHGPSPRTDSSSSPRSPWLRASPLLQRPASSISIR